MNRKDRRNLEKRLPAKRGLRAKVSAALKLLERSDNITPPQMITNGARVMLNVESIKGRQNYGIMSEGYKTFVEENKDTVFTATVDRDNLVSFREAPQWWFWSGDLIKLGEAS